jgi:phenylacetate-CoA ligase
MPVKQQISLWQRFFNKDTVSGTILSSLLYYRHFHGLYSLLKKSQWWTSEQLIEYQNERLRKLITHAYDHVPYYRHYFNKAGLQLSDIRSVHDLHKLPLLTKEQVRDNIDDFRARNYPPYRFEPMSTGGTTGDPLTLYIEKGKTEASYFAFYLMMMERAQCRLTHRYLFIIQSDEFWKNQAFGRILTLSPYSLREENIQILFEKIRKVNPQYIIGFPSGISLLGHLIIKKRDNLFNELRAIICTGETLYEWQRKFLESIFCCKIFSFYNQSEQVIFAATCECSHTYHVFPEYGITELIDKDGQVITNEHEKGEIVGTGFTNDIFPFIRYRTGDMGVYTNDLCACGRHYPFLKKIEGRTQEFIVNKMGNELPVTGMYSLVPSSSNLIKEYQFLQREPGEIVLRIVRCEGFSDKDVQLILHRLTRRLGPGFRFSIEYVDSVKRTSEGKVQFLVKNP